METEIPHLASGPPAPQKLLLAPPDLLNFIFIVFISYLFTLFPLPHCRSSVQSSGDAEGDRDLIYLLQ